MPRKRLTQIFPWLLPLRRWQRKKLFYIKMRLDGAHYARELRAEILPHEVYSSSSMMVNRKSGFPIEYQMNKVFNLKLAAKPLNRVVIKPGETFSFWQLARYADKMQRYKDGLTLIDGKIVGAYGGGLCQLSSLLFWLFLHTPLEIVERRGHAVESIPPADEDSPCGTDATIDEGWIDLKVKNNTQHSFQLVIAFDDDYMYGSIYSDTPPEFSYEIFNSEVRYYRRDGRIYQFSKVCCRRTSLETEAAEEYELYQNTAEIGYKLPENIEIERAE